MAIGVVVGLVAAFALTRLMSSPLFGIGPLDAPTYLAARDAEDGMIDG